MNFGGAVVTVRYVVGQAGEVVEAAVIPEQSRADRDRYLELFEESALETVRNWRFVVVDPNDSSCAAEQARTTEFRFSYR